MAKKSFRQQAVEYILQKEGIILPEEPYPENW